MTTETSAPEQPRATKFGRLSLIFGALIWIGWCVYFILFTVLLGSDPGDEGLGYTLIFFGGGILSLLTVLLGIASVVLGIISLRKKDPKPAAAIAGLALSLICLAPYCLFGIFILIGGLQNFDPQELFKQLFPS
jgi:glucan phosphoethanolaminetransferase (alkaline phosphatase superfamily)